MTPAIAEAPQVRWTATLVRPQRDGNLRDARAELRRLDHKFGREFHARTAQIHTVVNGASETAHPTMAITYAGVKKKIQDGGEHWIADIFVMPGHRAWFDFSAEAVAHYHVAALLPHLDEARHFAEVVAVIRIAHDDESAARC